MSLTAIIPVVQSALDVLATFSGSAEDASRDSKISDAAQVISAVAPLIDGFSRGEEITPEAVRDALVGMDEALTAFDEEIARQEQGG